ncbi:MAG: glycosyltransferase family 4 protein [Candidatus Micrarchaeota archaeon]
MKERVLILDMGSKMNRFGGEARVAAQLHSKLSDYFETFYLGYETPYLKCNKNCHIIERSSIKLHSKMRTGLAENWILRVGYYFLAGRLINIGISKAELKSIFDKIKPDVVISNSLADFPILRLAKHWLEFKSIYIDHVNLSGDVFKNLLSKNSLPFTLGTGMLGLSINNMKRKFFNFFDANVALNAEQEEIIRKYTQKVAYIPNGIAKSKRDEKEIKRFKERYSLDDKFIVLYVGRMFERQKNVSTLIKAFKKIQCESMLLLLVGEGPSLSDYIELAKGDKRILFTGGLDDSMLNSAYWLSHVFVLPSFWEGFSITMLEAASHSLPILLSKKAYPKDFEKLKIKVQSFDPDSADDLANKINEMHSNRKIYDDAKKTSQKIANEFSEEKMINRYKELVLSLF